MTPHSASQSRQGPNRYSNGNINLAPLRDAGDRDRNCVPGSSLIKIADPRRWARFLRRPADCPRRRVTRESTAAALLPAVFFLPRAPFYARFRNTSLNRALRQKLTLVLITYYR